MMNKYCVSLILTASFALFLFSAPATAQTAKSAADAVTEIDVNGLKVLVKRRVNSPTVAAGLFIRGGVRNLTPQTSGIENMALSVAVEGSKSYPRATLRKELAATGSTVGAGSNVDFSVMSMGSTRQNFERSWKVFADLAMNPSFAAEDLELVRERTLTVLRGVTDTPESYLSVLEEKVVYDKHPYSISPNGSVETVGRFSAAELRAYHQKIMQTSQLLLVIVGDLDASVLNKMIADTLGKLPRGNYQEKSVPAISFTAPTVDVTERSLQTNYVHGVFSAPPLNSPDYYAMRVAISILATRVFQEVRVKNNLSYAPGSEMNNMSANTANITVSSTNVNRSVELMLNEIERLKNEKVSKSDILETSGFFLTTYYIGQQTNAAQAAELANYELIGRGWRSSLNFLDKIKAVEPEQVQAAAKSYMRNIRFIVLGDPAAVDRRVFLRAS